MTETPKGPAELLKLVNLAISDPGAFLARQREDRDGQQIYETIPHWGARAVIAALSEHAWLVPKVEHDQLAPVGPYIHGEWIHRDAGDSQVWHTREYAAQLLAAADEVDPARQSAPKQSTDTTDRGDE